MQNLPRALAGLGRFPQFILCQLAERKGKIIKLPLDYRSMEPGSILDKEIWLSFEEANDYLELLGDEYKLGFVFTREDPFFFYDIDKCIDENGELNPVAEWSLQAFAGAAVERSQSGTGLHIFGTGVCPEHTCKNIQMGIELYTEDRFVMLTGNDTEGNADLDCSNILPTLVDAYFSGSATVDDGEWNDFPHPDWFGPDDDDILIAKASKARGANSVFAGKATFKDLFEANEDVLSVAYPHDDNPWDGSSADAALAQHLAFWTGGNHERIRTIMERSELKREKWEAREEYYLPKTIRKACVQQETYYNSNGKKPDPTSPGPGPSSTPSVADHATEPAGTINPGSATMFVEEQVSFFAGCHYVFDKNRVLTPRGDLLDKQRFDVAYGGKLFSMDMANHKTSKSAWECFTNSQAYSFSKVDGVLFRPKEAPGAVINKEGRTYVNIYIPITTPQLAGDPSPFLDIVRRIVPDDRDREILLSYLAGIVQYPGEKFQYCLLLQGAEGNGKSTIGQAVEFAVGERYTTRPDAESLGGSGAKFNSWMFAMLLVILEEARGDDKGGGTHAALKTMITSPRLQFQAKGQDQFMGDNVANWFGMFNDKTSFPVMENNRRYVVIYSAQQSKSDVIASGMTSEYWAKWRDWRDNHNGREIINHWLHNYDIPKEFDPSLLSTGPISSSMEECWKVSKTPLEAAIEDAAGSDVPGFSGGWVSTMAAQDYLLEKRVLFNHNSFAKALANLGYVKHPCLSEGRSAHKIPQEGGRSRLYVTPGHLSINLSAPKEITFAYEKAQGYSVDPNEVFGNGSNQSV